MQLPQKCPPIPLHDLRRILELARILERQAKLPFPQMAGYLQAIYMLGYCQAGAEASEVIRQQLDAAIQVMAPRSSA